VTAPREGSPREIAHDQPPPPPKRPDSADRPAGEGFMLPEPRAGGDEPGCGGSPRGRLACPRVCRCPGVRARRMEGVRVTAVAARGPDRVAESEAAGSSMLTVGPSRVGSDLDGLPSRLARLIRIWPWAGGAKDGSAGRLHDWRSSSKFWDLNPSLRRPLPRT